MISTSCIECGVIGGHINTCYVGHIESLNAQLAAEKEARERAERERDGWKEAYDGEIEGNRTVSLTIGGQKENEPFRSFLKRVGGERKTAEARVKELEVENSRLREVLRNHGVRQPKDL